MKHLFSKRNAAVWTLVCCCLLLNVNTIRNEYVMDDDIIIIKNMYVQDGFGGIGKIMSSDAFQSFIDQMNAESPLGGGRYRPLSIVSFAVEQQLFGKQRGSSYMEVHEQLREARESGVFAKPEKEMILEQHAIADAIYKDNLRMAGIRHAIQVLFYILAIVALYNFLVNYLLPDHRLVAFIAVLLFVFHPIHTEVVANLKSRDEIFSLLFLSLSFSAFFRYAAAPRNRDLFMGLGTLLLALLSKEYALIFFLLLPIGIIVRYKRTVRESISSRWFLAATALTLLFAFLRFTIVGHHDGDGTHELLNEPFLLATPVQAIATKIFILGKYLSLLFFPHPLSYDYSYRQIPYTDFTNPLVWLSLLAWLGIVAAGIILCRKKHILAFAIALLLGFFMLVNNILFDIGAPMGERLIFHSSIGFCIIIAWLMVNGIHAIAKTQGQLHAFLTAILVIILVPAGYATILRNANWKNNYTLFTHDVIHLTNSATANCNAGTEIFNKGFKAYQDREVFTEADRQQLLPWANRALPYFSRSIQIYPDYVIARMNRGFCYLHINQLDSAAQDWMYASKLYNTRNPTLVAYANMLKDRGLTAGSEKRYAEAIHYFDLATRVDSLNAEAWDNLGGGLYMSGHLPEAGAAFKRALDINPGMQDAIQGYRAVMYQLGDTTAGAKQLQ